MIEPEVAAEVGLDPGDPAQCIAWGRAHSGNPYPVGSDSDD
jgi:hypothetical protein